MPNPDIPAARIAEIETEQRNIHTGAGERALTRSEQGQWDRLDHERRGLADALAELEADDARRATVDAARAKWGSVQVSTSGGSAWDGLDTRGETPAGWISRAHSALDSGTNLADSAREMLADALSDHDGDKAARFIVARSDPSYLSAFHKVLVNPERGHYGFTPQEAHAFGLVESCRAAMGTGTGTAGYAIPLALDPALAAIANDGVANPWRAKSTVKQAISSPHRALTSAGITADWTAEGVAFGDNSPTLGAVDVPLFKLTGWVNATFEVFADAGDTLSEVVPMLLADARDVAEGSAFATGDGTTQPKGVVSAISATVASTVTATTRGSFTSASATDTLALLNALPPRARQSSRVGAFANVTHISSIRQQVVGTAGVPIVDMGSAVPTPLGVPLHESSAMSAAQTSGTVLVVAGDMSKYLIVDSIAGPTLEFVPVVMDQATGRPNGTRGWLYHSRTGGDLVDVSRWRFLLA